MSTNQSEVVPYVAGVHTDVPSTIRVLSRGSAKKLADMYLQTHLRDFFLAMHPLVQAYVVDASSCPEEFFILVLQEVARFEKLNMRYDHRRGAWVRDAQAIVDTVDAGDYLGKIKQQLLT